MNNDRVVRIVKKLEKGKVVTYGDISKAVYGHRKAGTAVGQAIKREAECNDKFPWWRVCFKGLRPKDGAQEHLKKDGVGFLADGTVLPEYEHKLQSGGKK